jgi:hypothetical protein
MAQNTSIPWSYGLGLWARSIQYERWRKGWQDLFFISHSLVHNIRKIQKIVVSPDGDGAYAIVDVDTLWKNIATGNGFTWKGVHARFTQSSRRGMEDDSAYRFARIYISQLECDVG